MEEPTLQSKVVWALGFDGLGDGHETESPLLLAKKRALAGFGEWLPVSDGRFVVRVVLF